MTSVPRVLFCEALLEGKVRFATTLYVSHRPAKEALLAGWDVVRAVEEDRLTTTLAGRPGALMLLGQFMGTNVDLAATTSEGLDRLVAEVRTLLGVETEVDGTTFDVAMWSHLGTHASRRLTRLEGLQWESVRSNYSAATAQALDPLMGITSSAVLPPGRLMLWHGEPGTGKTSAVRALCHAWQSWCGAAVVVDPDRFFANAGYIADVIGDPRNTREWTLVIAEDSDDHLTEQFGGGVHGPLGRLLNLTDGLLGQGSRTVVLVTTNAPVDRVHPAIVRPGRCMANIEFTRLSPGEVGALAGKAAAASMTLAEAYEYRRSGRSPAMPWESSGYA